MFSLFKKKTREITAISAIAAASLSQVVGQGQEPFLRNQDNQTASLSSSNTYVIPKQLFVITSSVGVKAREQPSTSARYLGFSLQKDTTVFAIREHVDQQGNIWINVLSPSSQKTFWICRTFNRTVLAKKSLTYEFKGDFVTQAYMQYSEIFSKQVDYERIIAKDFIPKLRFIKNKLEESVSYYDQNGNLKQNTRLQIAKEIGKFVDLPYQVIVAVWYRENSNMPTTMYFHNGRDLGREMTLNGKRYFFRENEFFQAAKDTFNSSYYMTIKKRLHLHYNSTDMAAIATFIEAHRGFMHRKAGELSPYTFSGTTFQVGSLQHNGQRLPVQDRRPGFVAISALFRSG